MRCHQRSDFSLWLSLLLPVCVSLCVSVSSVDRRSRSEMGGEVSSFKTQLTCMLKYFREGFMDDDGYVEQWLL